MLHQPAEIIGDKYRIERFLGAGAFGEVYLATHLKLNAPRALKLLSRSKSGLASTEFNSFHDRFTLEAQLGARLDNPNVVRVHDFEHIADELVLVMEFASGGSLADRIRTLEESGQAMPVIEAVRIGQEVAEGLAAIHALDVVHRDLKPSNILFDEHGRAKIADLGLAQIPGGMSARSQLGSLALSHPGTPAYMSPEQESTPGYLKPPSDVYSLGIILFELLTNRHYKNLEPGTRSNSLRREVPDWLDELLTRMLVDDPRQRPWNGEKVAGLLRSGLTQESARREAEEHTRQEAVEKARLDEEKRQRLMAETTRLEAEKRAREETDNKRRQDEEEKQRLARLAAEAARLEAEANARREALSRQNKPGAVSVSDNRMSIRQADGVSMEFVHVPAGEFLMGSDKKKDPQTFEWELPQHKVDLSEYWIGRFPVTVAQFTAFIKASGRQCSAEANPKKGDHPVTQVSWNDADAFCTWLTRLIQASGQKNLKVHLPSEAQWEKAARGTDARIYPWGNQKLSDKLCNYGRKVGSTTPVGQYSPQGDSPYGCVDMAGNVWEWTQDWLDSNYYQHSAGKDPGGTSSGEHRVLRGGSWLDSGWVVRAALRGWGSPDLRSVDIGFRCAASP